jgi:altronate dehydratase small subunit
MSDLKLVVSQDEKTALVIDHADNVAVALTDLRKGDVCLVRKGDQTVRVTVLEDIPFGHKLAIKNIAKDESVLKYGEEIGKMKVSVEQGGWIHNHNMYCERGTRHG